MKKVTLIGSAVFLITFVIGIVVALQTGEKAPLYFQAQLEIPAELTARAKEHRVLFVILYDPESKIPRPYGAARYLLQAPPAGKFLTVSITPENLQVMSPRATPLQKFNLKVRLDVDGQAGKDQPGDIFAKLNDVAYGSTNLNIVLNQVVPAE